MLKIVKTSRKAKKKIIKLKKKMKIKENKINNKNNRYLYLLPTILLSTS